MNDHDWKYQMTALLAEVRTNQVNMSAKLDTYIGDSQERLDTLDSAVFGDKDAPGLTEEVRGFKGKWAIVYGVGLLIGSALLNQIVGSAVAKASPKVNVTATVSSK